MIITLCGSIKFAEQMQEIAQTLEKSGYQVFYPKSANEPDFQTNPERALMVRSQLIKRHLDYIEKSDAVLLVNLTKNDIEGYLGVSALAEAIYAFGRGKQIFALNTLPPGLGYSVDLAALKPIVINGDLTKIENAINPVILDNNNAKMIARITDKDFDENAPDFDDSKAWQREAVRAILLNTEGKIALIHAQKYNYYKLPGGGIQPNENHEQALRRELLEEVGAEIKIIGEVGKIEELRTGSNHMRQISYTYIAEVVGEIGETHLEADEQAEEFKTVWAAADEAEKLLRFGNVSSEKGLSQRFMTLRDELFVKEYKKIVTKGEANEI